MNMYRKCSDFNGYDGFHRMIPATKKSHPRQNASGLLISTYPSDCNGFGDLPPVQVSAVRCTQIALKPVYVQLRLDIKNKIHIIIISDPSAFQNFFGSVKNVGVVVTLIYFRALFFLKNDWF